jgi:hypothetical protein
MTLQNLSRRAILAGATAAPALALPSMGAATETITGPDRELRRLWSEYLTLIAADDAVMAKYTPAHTAYEAELPPCPEGVLPGDHLRAHESLWRKHGLDKLWDQRNSIDTAQRETIAAILSTKAEGLFGIAVKLSAMPDGAQYDQEDWTEATAVVLDDIDRLLGTDFGTRFCEIYEPGDLNRTWEPDEREDEDEAVQS